MGAVFKKLKERWTRNAYGIVVGSGQRESRLTHLLFADDMTILAKNRAALVSMLTELAEELALVGLRLNTAKCYVQTNAAGINSARGLRVQDSVFPMAPAKDGFKVLGVQWCLVGGTDVEFDRRLASAWRRFYQLWPMLSSKGSSLTQRMKLLHVCVSGVVLWGCKSWTLTKRQKQRLKSTQNEMFRKVANVRRRPEEDYVAWLRRATQSARIMARNGNIPSWLHLCLSAKWRWAGHVARMPDDRWALRVTKWREELRGVNQWQRPVRVRAGAFRRWKKELQAFCDHCGLGQWQVGAQDRAAWASRADAFATWAT
jgi:hypothetical protein